MMTMPCDLGLKRRIRFLTFFQWAPCCTLPKGRWDCHACQVMPCDLLLRTLMGHYCYLCVCKMGLIRRIGGCKLKFGQYEISAETYRRHGFSSFVLHIKPSCILDAIYFCQAPFQVSVLWKLSVQLPTSCYQCPSVRSNVNCQCRAILAIRISSKMIIFNRHVTYHPTDGCRIGEAKNPGPENGSFVMKFCLLNPTAIYNKVDIITNIDSQIYQIAENSATNAIQLATQPEFRKLGYQTHWSPAVAAHAGVSLEETSYRGQATGVSMHSLFPIRSSRVKVPDDIDHTRILSTIAQIGHWKIHFVTIYGYPSCHQKSKERTNALVEAAAKMIDQVNLPSIVAGDFNHPFEQLAAGQTLVRCGFANLQQIYRELYQTDMPPTCRETTSPDQVIISSELHQYVSAVLVDKQKMFSDHDPILYQLHLPINPPMKTIWKMPQSWLPFQPDSTIFDREFVRLADKYQLPLTPESAFEIPSLPDALELWARVTESAVDATIRQQHLLLPEKYPQKHLPKKCRGRGQPRYIKSKPFGDSLRSACQGQYDPPGEATNIRLKLVVRQTRRVQSLYYRMSKISQDTTIVHAHHYEQLLQEWAAITNAKGFGKSFPHWCTAIPEINVYPYVLPSIDYLLDLSQFLKIFADQMSHDLQNLRAARSRFNRYHLETMVERSRISKIVKTSQLPMVESIQTQVQADIVDLRDMQGLVEIDFHPHVHFRHDEAIKVGDVVCDVIDQNEKTLTVVQRDADCEINTEHKVTQTQWTHEPSVVAASLNHYWDQFWNRDRHNAPDWQDFTELLNDTPELPPVTVVLDDIQIWKKAAQSMKSRSARGVDGFLVDELKTLPDSAFAALSQIFVRSPSQSFGQNLAQVITLPLSKVEEPSQPSQTRPITLIAVLYRLWAKTTTMQILHQWKDNIPDYIIGFLPGRSPEIEMIKQQYLFEQAHSKQQNVGVIWEGLTLDLVKCFNLIGRVPAKMALVKAGIPLPLVSTWYETLMQQTRLWKVNQQLFSFDSTTTGTPEGDSWSVLACISLSRIWANQIVVAGAQPSCYADNWSIKTDQTVVTEVAIDLTIKCANAFKLLIDWAKTWCWRTSSQRKTEWKQRMQRLLPQEIQIQIVTAARELGYTMAYNKVQSRQTQKQRHEQAAKRIYRLRKMRTSLQVRALICTDACLSKALFATATYHVGNPWIKELRTLIAKTLIPDRKNSNPFLATQLLSPHVRDPEVHLILESIRCIRRFLYTQPPQEQDTFFFHVSRHSGNHHDVFGPAGALRTNLQRIGWQLDKHGWLLTDTQVQFHILRDNLPDILQYVEHCWMKHVMQCRIIRKHWQQFPIPDRVATTSLLKQFNDSQQQVLAVQITGAYMLGDQRMHIDDASEQCTLCLQPEDIHHRILDCPSLQHVRTNHQLVVDYLREHNDCHLYLPVVFQPTDFEFNTWFFQQLPEPDLLPEVAQQAHEELQRGIRPQFWTDGSCNTPSHRAHRRAAFGIVFHPHVNPDEIDRITLAYRTNKVLPDSFQVVGSAPCRGNQTIPRAEMQAIVVLIQHFDSAQVITDSQYVIDQSHKIGYFLDHCRHHKLPNFDLLVKLWDRLQTGDFVLTKVKAHALSQSQDNPLITFQQLGNEVADIVAKQARLRFEKQCPIAVTHKDLDDDTFVRKNLVFRYDLQVERSKLLYAKQQVSKPMYASKTFKEQLQKLCPVIDDPWTFTILPDDFQAIKACLWGTQYAMQILRWLETLRWPADVIQGSVGISWYELACNFIMVTQTGLVINEGGTGPSFRPQRQCATSSQVLFSRQVFCFERAITNIQSILRRQILPTERTTATSVRCLGLSVGKSGLQRRPQMLYQDELATTLIGHFARGDIPAQVPQLPIMRASITIDEQLDDIQHAADWTQRIRIHNREKKKRY